MPGSITIHESQIRRYPVEDTVQYKDTYKEASDMSTKELKSYILGSYENMGFFGRVGRALLNDPCDKLDIFERNLRDRKDLSDKLKEDKEK